MRQLLLSLVLLLAAPLVTHADPPARFYSFTLNSIDGQPTPFRQFQGKVVLLVNVASACGYTPQYAALEALYEKYKGRGFLVVGVPANNFANQESGTNAEIKSFCTRKYHVSFPMMAKVSVLGPDKTPLYQYLTDRQQDPTFGGEIQWNFTKFLLSRKGKPVARFEPAVKPDSPEVISAIETALNNQAS